MSIQQELMEKLKDYFSNESLWHSCSPDSPPCAICKRLIVSPALRVFDDKKDKELCFHVRCVNEKCGNMIQPTDDIEFLDQTDESTDTMVTCVFCEDFDDCDLISKEGKEEIKKHSQQ